MTLCAAGTFDGVDYYTASFSVQTGPEAYMISTIYYYMYRTTADGEPYGMWEIREDQTPANGNQGPPLSYIFWSGTPTSTPPLSGWSNGSLATTTCGGTTTTTAAPTTTTTTTTAEPTTTTTTTTTTTSAPTLSGYNIGSITRGDDDYAGNYTISGTSPGNIFPSWQHESKNYILAYQGGGNGWLLFPGTIEGDISGSPIAFQSCGFPGGGSGTCTDEIITGTYATSDGEGTLFTVTDLG
jgi:hypothetical protein